MHCRFPWAGFDMPELPASFPSFGGIVKDDVVMFGELIPLDVLEGCFDESNCSDCMLVVGTSATVHLAAGHPLFVRREGGTLIDFNPYRTELSDTCDVCVRSPLGETLPLFIQKIRGML